MISLVMGVGFLALVVWLASIPIAVIVRAYHWIKEKTATRQPEVNKKKSRPYKTTPSQFSWKER